MDTGRGRREKADFTGWGRVDRAQGNGAPQCYPRRTGFNRELLAPPPAKAGGGWEGVPTVRADPEDTPPQPSPAFAGEGAKSSRLKPLLQGFAERQSVVWGKTVSEVGDPG